jgi:hypothetical protein
MAAGLILAGAAHADDVVFDQSCTPEEISSSWSIALLGPVGQEFVPQAGKLDVVELFVVNEDGATPEAAALLVRIRHQAIGGSVAGASDTVEVAWPHYGPVRFHFRTPVETAVGQKWVIELAAAGGGGNAAIAAGPSVDPYPSGRGIVGGTPLAMADMWFRTGLGPLAISPATWTAVKRLFRG